MSAAKADEELRIGDEVADAVVVERMSAAAGFGLYRARRADGSEATVVAAEGMPTNSRRRFLSSSTDLAERLGKEPVSGIARPVSVDPVAGACIVDVAPTGTLADVPLLSWSADQKVELLRAVCRSLHALHVSGQVHGSLRPELVVLDEAIAPHLAAPGAIDAAAEYRATSPLIEALRPYTAPEVRHGRAPDERADVYAVGRLLHFLLSGSTPEERDEATPRLDSLADKPPGLVRIVRKCTTVDPERRYRDPERLERALARYLEDMPVGMRHPEVDGPGEEEEDEEDAPPARPSGRPTMRSKPLRSMPPRGIGRATRKGWWSAAFGVGSALGGITLVALATFLSSLADEPGGLHWLSMAVIGAFLLALAPPPWSRRPLLVRLAIFAAGLAVIVLVDPTRSLETPATPVGRLRGASVADRVSELERLAGEGETLFMQNDLARADLSGRDLSNLKLDGSNLSGCDCRGTNLSNASLLNVEVAGADFSGANLASALPDFMPGFAEAKCDAKTVMPAGWLCESGQPRTIVAR